MMRLRRMLRNLGKTLGVTLAVSVFIVFPVVLLMVLQHHGYVKIFPYDSIDLILGKYGTGKREELESTAQSATPSVAAEWLSDLFRNWVSFLVFEKHDLLFFILGLMIGLLTTNTALLSSLGVLLTARRIISGWLSGTEWAVIIGALALELLPLGTDLTVFPIMWTILTWRTTFWLALGAHISRFFVEQFPPRGVFALMIRFVGFLGLFFALLDVLGFGVMGMLPRRWL